MQTKNFHSTHADHAWNNLTTCTRRTSANTYSIRCEIDASRVRLRYNLRLIRLTRGRNLVEEANLGPYTVLVPPTRKGHYQDGLLCYPSHALLNLRSLNVTGSSAVVAWSFHTWDVQLIRNMAIRVKHNTDIITELSVRTGSHMALHQERTIGGLEGCKAYTVELHYEYTYHDRGRRHVSVNTTCPPHAGRGETLKFSLLELLVILLCSLLLVVGVLFLAYFLHQAREHYRSKKVQYEDVVDVKDLLTNNAT